MKLSNLKPRDFLRALVLTTFGLVTSFIGLNVLVDPYRFFGMLLKPGFNELKPKPSILRDEVRLNLAILRQPTVVIVGNSRVEAGFNPNNLTATDLRTQSQVLAVPGNTIANSIPSLIELGNKAPLQKVLIGLEIQDYLTARDTLQPALTATKLDRIVLPDLTRLRWRSAASIDTFKDSIKTLLIQRQEYPETLAASGFNPSLDYIRHVSEIGHHGLFSHALGSLKGKIDQAKKIKGFGIFVPSSPRLSEITLILALAKERQWDVELFFYPLHAEALALYEDNGLGELVVEWKNTIAKNVEIARKSGVKVKLWDFSCLSEVTTEPIPAKSDFQTKMKYYWESGHFKESVGDLIINRILKGSKSLELGANASPITDTDAQYRFDQCRAANKTFSRKFNNP
jgi:hypothetical protein